jgi:uncharacterized membrane protein HdeD (DUF308 family)
MANQYSAAGEAAPHEALAKLGRSWGWLCAFGVLTLLAGVAVLAWPGATILTLALIFGIQLLIGGIFWFVSAFSSDEKHVVVQILLAVLSVLAGVIVLRYPVQTAFIFPLILGAFWTVNGIAETFQGIAGRSVSSRGWAIASGLLSILAGIALLVYPGIGLVTMAFLLGIWLLVYGGIAVVRSVRMRPRAVTAPTARRAGPAPA